MRRETIILDNFINSIMYMHGFFLMYIFAQYFFDFLHAFWMGVTHNTVSYKLAIVLWTSNNQNNVNTFYIKFMFYCMLIWFMWFQILYCWWIVIIMQRPMVHVTYISILFIHGLIFGKKMWVFITLLMICNQQSYSCAVIPNIPITCYVKWLLSVM